MSTPSPALADALALLSDDLYAHLDEAEALASEIAVWSDDEMQTARQLIPDLVEVIRGVLIEHQLEFGGECRGCASAWPCPVVTTVHAVVKDPQRRFIPLVRRARACRTSDPTINPEWADPDAAVTGNCGGRAGPQRGAGGLPVGRPADRPLVAFGPGEIPRAGETFMSRYAPVVRGDGSDPGREGL